MLQPVDGGQPVERARQHAGQEQHRQGQGHARHVVAQGQRRRHLQGRVQAPRQRHRDQAEHAADRHEHQRSGIQFREQANRQLAQYGAQTGRDHVEAEHRPPRGILGLLVEPAFNGDEQADHGDARDKTQRQPDPQIVDQDQCEHGDGDQRRAGRIGADVAHADDQPVSHPGAQHQAQVIRGDHRPDPDLGDGQRCQPQAQVRIEEPGTEQQDQGRQVKGKECADRLGHAEFRSGAPPASGFALKQAS